VVATQNPIEMEGTYRLPEAQLDRFLMRIEVGYPPTEAEIDVLRSNRGWATVEQLQPVLGAMAIQRMIDVAAEVFVSDGILRYVTAIAEASRTLEGVRLGISPRGSLALIRAARARAASQNRTYVAPEDIKALVGSVLTHRLMITAESEVQGHTPESVLEHLLAHIPVPTRRDR
jgi:MoxR-like ATPase